MEKGEACENILVAKSEGKGQREIPRRIREIKLVRIHWFVVESSGRVL